MTDFGLSLFFVAAAAPPATLPPIQFAWQVVEQQIIIRIPLRRPLRQPQARSQPALVWRETEAASCQPAQQIAQARFTRPGVIDFLMRDRRVLRARLDSDCVNLGYYSSFYLVPGDDGRICVDRDLVQSRAGGQCAISAFRTLQVDRGN